MEWNITYTYGGHYFMREFIKNFIIIYVKILSDFSYDFSTLDKDGIASNNIINSKSINFIPLVQVSNTDSVKVFNFLLKHFYIKFFYVKN